jgi:hypothetical protein
MPNILDTLDVIQNLQTIYENDKSFRILKDFERVLDELGLYVYANWEDGELVEGPIVSRHWVTCTFMWPKKNMPDPMGGRRLIDYDCEVRYEKSSIIKPRQIKNPDDIRPGTKKGKLDKIPVWLVEIQMPKKLIVDVYQGDSDLEKIEDALDKDTGPGPTAPPPAAPGMAPPAAPAPAPAAAPVGGDLGGAAAPTGAI